MSTNDVSPTKNFAAFSLEVEAEFGRLLNCVSDDKGPAEKLLNGAAAEAVQKFVTQGARAADGIYFSSQVLSRLATSLIADRISAGATVADPACGAGDLLIACASLFNSKKNLSATLDCWEDRIFGCDLHNEFVSAARSRLRLLAASVQPSGQCTLTNAKRLLAPFKNIVAANYLENVESLAKVDCIVMNPPFGNTLAPADCKWGSGNVQLAGVFVHSALKAAKTGQEIVAILPDVLRSGTRYKRWRETISASARIKKVIVYGRFDQKTDVDVFVVHLEKLRSTTEGVSNWQAPISDSGNQSVVADSFRVSVGAYVPFRAKQDDSEVDYLCVSEAIPDAEIVAISSCRFNGTLHSTPCVVVRRTSNPSDARRVIPTLVYGPSEIAIENHLLVLSPLDGTLKTCKRLMSALQKPSVDLWMNEAIRCRHLTTESLKTLPLEGWL